MNDPRLIIIVWGILCLVLLLFVGYRFITDKNKNSNTHAFYPLVSNPGDSVFPSPKNKLGIFAYIFIVIGLIAFLGLIGMMILDKEHPIWLIHVAGVFFYFGIFMQWLNNSNKKNS
jgi:hypothetical protein